MRPFFVFQRQVSHYDREILSCPLAIEQASRVAYQYFSRLASGGQYGRQIGR